MNNQDCQGIIITLLVYLVITTSSAPILGPDVAFIVTIIFVGCAGLIGTLFLFVYIGTIIESIIEKIQAFKVPPWVPKAYSESCGSPVIRPMRIPCLDKSVFSNRLSGAL